MFSYVFSYTFIPNLILKMCPGMFAMFENYLEKSQDNRETANLPVGLGEGNARKPYSAAR